MPVRMDSEKAAPGKGKSSKDHGEPDLTDGKSVDEVVYPISEYDHPGHSRDLVA